MVTGIETKGSVSNDAVDQILLPYTVGLRVQGAADLLFHRYSPDEVEEKGKAAKGSRTKKSDNIEAYVYRNGENHICMPGRYIQRAVVEAARFHQDPRSPRKMAKDLVTAGVVSTTSLAPVLVNGNPTEEWDYLDRQRVVIQRSAITRCRPAFVTGWQVDFEIAVLLPEYVSHEFLYRLVTDAGRFIGLGDFRPTYGRYNVVNWQIL